MEEASGETNQTPKENSRDTGEVAGDQVTVGAEVNHDVDKTLYDAEEFLSNFAGLRDENEQLKQANHELQLQLEKARQDIEQLQLDKQTLEAQLLQEREQSKEELWKVRSEFQALQDERLQWKEKYLNVCMKAANQPTGLGEGSTSSGNKSKGLKRKQGSMSNLNESNSDDFYSNLSSTFGLNDQDDQQPEGSLSPQITCIPSLEEALVTIKEHELANSLKFSVHSVTKDFGVTDFTKNAHKVYWSDGIVAFSGVPFFLVGCKVLDCQFGRDRNGGIKQRSKLNKASLHYLGYSSKTRREQSSKKCDCSAQVQIKEIIQFPEDKVFTDTTHNRRKMSSKLRDALKKYACDVKFNRQFIVIIPNVGTHRGHSPPKVVAKIL